MQAGCRNTCILELVSKLLSIGARASKDQSLSFTRSKLFDNERLVAVLYNQDTVVNGGRRLVFTGNFVHCRILEEFLHDSGNTLVQGCREQQTLSISLGGTQDALHGLEEAQVAHVVSLIQHRDGDVRKVDVTLLNEVFQTTGGRNDDVHATAQAHHLLVLRNTTEDGGGEETNRASDGLHGAINLHSELTGGSHNQSTRCTSLLAVLATVVLHQALNNR